tara:strand:- start:442 stop:753 length:312 start_codon:yes stop_codon:yes gene_type:complete
MIEPTYRGLPIVTAQTRKGQRNVLDELSLHSLDVWNVKFIVEKGYACSRSKRRKDVIERCINKGAKTFKVVIQRGYLEHISCECWEIIHVGSFTRRKNHERYI